MIDINDLIGTPFSDDPDLAYGPDFYSCYGLLVEVYSRYGIKLYQTNIAVTACRQRSLVEIDQHLADWIQIDQPRVPCGILIRSVNPAFADHIGVYIGSGKMLHTTIKMNVCVEPLEKWQQKIIGFYKYVGHHNHHP